MKVSDMTNIKGAVTRYWVIHLWQWASFWMTASLEETISHDNISIKVKNTWAFVGKFSHT